MSDDDDFGELYADVEVPCCENREAEENGSDSEDDLRIVLNDKQLQHNNNDSNEVVEEQSCETGNGNGIYSQYHQHYKYIRPQLPANANGFASSRCDWDTNGCNNKQLLVSIPRTRTRTRATGYGYGYGYDFSLPRHRTILDVDIDSFLHKPWKHPGVDISHFFNFGLDEETWKQYCNCMELFRQQTTMVTEYQVHGAQVRHQNPNPQNVRGESAQIGQEGVLSISNDANNRRGRFEIPKGRAIQVDGGIGERRPSMDIRRPQNRDSDVVIQIPVQDDMKCSSFSSSEEQSLSDNSTLNVFESVCPDMAVSQDGFSAESADEYKRQGLEACVNDVEIKSPQRHLQQTNASTALLGHPDRQGYKDILGDVACQPHKENKHICTQNFEDGKVKMQRKSFIADPCTLDAESTLSDQIQRTSSLSYYEASVIGTSCTKDKVHLPERREPLSLITGLHVPVTLACNQSKDLESSYCRTEEGDNKDQSRNLSCKRGKQGTPSRVRHRTHAETTNSVGDKEALAMLTKNVRHADSHLRKRSRRWGERQYEKDEGEEGLPYYRETEISFGYLRETFVNKPVRDAYTESIIENRPTKVRNEMNPCLRGHLDEQEYILKKTFTFRGSEARQRKNFLNERQNSNERLHPNQDRSICLTPKNSSSSIEKGKCRWQKRKKNDEYIWWGPDDDDCVLDHGYRELYMQGDRGRPVSYHDRKRGCLNENYCKNISDRRDRNGCSPYVDVLTTSSLDGSQSYKYWRHSLSPHREHGTHESKWCDTTSPVTTMYSARKSDEEDMGLCRQTLRERNQSNGLFKATCQDTHNAVTVTISDFNLSNKERTRICRSEVLDWPDGVAPRQHNQGKVYAKRSSRYGGIHFNKFDSSRSEMLLEEKSLVHVGNRKLREETRDSGFNTRIVSSFNIVDENEDKKMAPRQRKSIDLQVVGWNGKASERFSSAGDTGFVRRKGAFDSSNREHKHSAQNWLYSGKVTPDTLNVINGNLHRLNSKIEKVGDSPTSFDMNHNQNCTQNSFLEEGQLLEAEYRMEDVHLLDRYPHLKETTKNGVINEENVHLCEVMSENKLDEEHANRRILETLAKMEKRRERFKEPIILKEADISPMQQPDTVVEPTESNQQRPVRKRRWGRN